MFQIENRDARTGPPENLEVQLVLTDIPYGTGKLQTGPAGSYFDYRNLEYVAEGLKAWVPSLRFDGTFVVCCDYRSESMVLNAMNEAGLFYRGSIVWEFGLGRPRTSWWPNRHNYFMTFTHTPTSGLFHSSAVPAVKRLAPKPGYSDTKPAGSVWDFTLSNTDPERVGYPNQKPVAVIEPFVLAHTNPGDLVADPFCGSGTTGLVAVRHGRDFWGSDTSETAIKVTLDRLQDVFGDD